MCLSEGLYFEFPLSMESSYGLLYIIFYFTFALFHDSHETNWWYEISFIGAFETRMYYYDDVIKVRTYSWKHWILS